MRRVTLILSDLYLPEEAAGDLLSDRGLALPAFEWLLRFARAAEPIGDWRSWLAAELDRAAITRWSLAQFASRVVLPPGVLLRDAWLATPVSLEARLDHVRLRDRGLLHTTARERAQWCEDFSREFGPAYLLHDAGPRGFLLTGLAATDDVATTDPARLLDCDVRRALPPASARELRRLGAEIEMWMHSATANAVRVGHGLPPITTLWLWGGGPHEPEPAQALVLPASMSTTVFHGDDPWLAALSREVTGQLPAGVPMQCGALADRAGHAIVELAPMSGAREESLTSLESRWFAPMRAALESGAIASADIVANDLCFRVAKRAGWRFWRQRAAWLTKLGRPRAARA